MSFPLDLSSIEPGPGEAGHPAPLTLHIENAIQSVTDVFVRLCLLSADTTVQESYLAHLRRRTIGSSSGPRAVSAEHDTDPLALRPIAMSVHQSVAMDDELVDAAQGALCCCEKLLGAVSADVREEPFQSTVRMARVLRCVIKIARKSQPLFPYVAMVTSQNQGDWKN